jgi:PAS domain S-box-containing protein
MRIQTANDAILKAWEKDASVIGKTFREALPELEGQPVYGLLDNVYTTGIPYEAKEDRVDLYRNGKLTPTYWTFNYTPLRNEEGEIYGVMNTATEVTELVMAKKKLLAAEEALLSAIETGGLGTWRIDLENDHVTYDDRIRHWFGLPEGGAPLSEVIGNIQEGDRERVQQAVQHALDTKGIYDAEYKVTNPNTGRERILHAKGKVAVDENGDSILLSGICRDVTLQRETEKELTRKVELRTVELQKANAELNSLNENLKQFVYVASHDLQEPLRKINLFSDILNEASQGELNSRQKEYLFKIARSAKRMTSLIKDLLDYSRAEATEGVFTSTNLQQVLGNVIEDYELMIEQKNAVVTIGELPVLTAIPMQVNQLFYNLLGNALKFSGAGIKPVISITSRLLSKSEVLADARLDNSKSYTEILISDNGIGFDQEFSEQIFIIFQRLHGKYEYEGTGIGLALCKKIVENHSGIIFAEGKRDEGASFHIILPLHRS